MDPQVFGPYRVEALLGRGGMGEVHRAYDTVRERVVALKRLPAALASDAEFQARFRKEAALAGRLHEPHIIPIHDYGEIDGVLYIDMRLVEGHDLAKLLADHGPLSAARAVNIVGQVAAALDVAHAQDLVHRDVKPGNVLVTAGTIGDTGNGEFVYVADFGIARALSHGSTSLTATGATVGSLDYMAPERFTGGHGDRRVDVYSLGCLLFEALTARKPFRVEGVPALIYAHLHMPPPRPSELVDGLPPRLDDVVARAMAKDPDERFASAGALAAAARAALDAPSGAAATAAAAADPGGPGTIGGADIDFGGGAARSGSAPLGSGADGRGAGPDGSASLEPEPGPAAEIVEPTVGDGVATDPDAESSEAARSSADAAEAAGSPAEPAAEAGATRGPNGASAAATADVAGAVDEIDGAAGVATTIDAAVPGTVDPAPDGVEPDTAQPVVGAEAGSRAVDAVAAGLGGVAADAGRPGGDAPEEPCGQAGDAIAPPAGVPEPPAAALPPVAPAPPAARPDPADAPTQRVPGDALAGTPTDAWTVAAAAAPRAGTPQSPQCPPGAAAYEVVMPPSPPPPAPPRRTGLLAGLAALFLVVLLGAGVMTYAVARTLDEVRTEPVLTSGENPFMPPVGGDKVGVTPPVRSGGEFSGATSGLYGGTLNNATCDPGAMADFLERNPDKGAAWAAAQGIAPSQVRSYISGLTPAVLRSDTRVTNHGFRDGQATPLQSVLQAGTAVLVDEYGVPRARCSCGNPLAPPQRLSQPKYTGASWPTFSPQAVTVIVKAPVVIEQFTMVDPSTGEVFERPRGSRGDRDVPRDPAPVPVPPPTPMPVPAPPPAAKRPTETVAPPAPVPVPQPVPQSPSPQPKPEPHPPKITGYDTSEDGPLIYLSVSYTDLDGDAEGFGFKGANGSNWAREEHPFDSPSYGQVSSGTVTYPFNHDCGGESPYSSDVEFWIYDSGGRESKHIVAHLQCQGGVG